MSSKLNALIDFYPGTHGHFLEYVVNTYIYKMPKVDKVFTDLGTAHGIVSDRHYQLNKQIRCGHFSERGRQMTVVPPKLIRITVSGFKAHVCFYINSDYRAWNDPSRRLLNLTLSIKEQRDAYYYRLTDKKSAYYLRFPWLSYTCEVFELDMIALYEFDVFVTQLRKLADFLKRDFLPDDSLKILWQEFISKNHGVLAWDKCHLIFSKIVSGEPYEFTATVEEQALINALIYNMTNSEPEELFVTDNYPTNTVDISKILQLN